MTEQRLPPFDDTPDVIDATGWRCMDFLSDLHLQAAEPANFQAWSHHMATTPAQAVFILGDLFEVWIGDDVLDADNSGDFERECVQVLRQAAQRLSVFWCPSGTTANAQRSLRAENRAAAPSAQPRRSPVSG